MFTCNKNANTQTKAIPAITCVLSYFSITSGKHTAITFSIAIAVFAKRLA